MPKTTLPLAVASPGTRRVLSVYRFGRPGARPKVYFQAALHADEFPGLLVAHHLLRLLEQAEAAGRVKGEVVIVPVANPVGLGQHLNGHLVGRFDFETGINFNRNFPAFPTAAMLDELRDRLGTDPATNTALIRETLLKALREWKPAREADALKIALLGLSIDADGVFDLHCDGESLLHLYASKHHRNQAMELGAEIGAAAILLEQDPGGSPFDDANAGPWWRLRERLGASAAIPLACFATTVELRGRADVHDRHAERDAANLYRFLQRRAVVAGEPGPLPPLTCQPVPLEGVDVLTAPAAGIVAYRKELGDAVAKGEVVAELVDLSPESAASARTPIVSRTDGVLFARMMEKLVRPGQKICKIAGAEPLAHRPFGALLED